MGGNVHSVGRRVLALYIEGQEIALQEGELILGRSPSCDIVIDDMLASRVHAKLSMLEGAVVLRDLGSSNGVYVNGSRIDMPTALRDGDRILLGTKEISVFAVRVGGTVRPDGSGTHAKVGSAKPPAGSRLPDRSRMEPSGYSSIPSPRAQHIQQLSRDLPHTEKTSAFAQLGLLVRRMIDSGQTDGAIRVLAEHMRNVIEGVRDGQPLPNDVLASSSEFAMEFAEAKLEAKWVDYVVELHLNVRRPMSGALIDRLCALRRKNVCCDRELLLFYKAALQREEPNLPLSQRVLCARIFSLGESEG